MGQYRIGDVTGKLGLSADTLRYYERIGLLSRVARNAAGIRFYNDRDISRIKFIQRAQKMNFTLVEIAELLRMRAAPQRARAPVRVLTAKKLAEVELQVKELQTLRDELQLLLNLCASGRRSCAIIKKIDRS
ncbi:MAG: heavy metal-responsive transcriptional regulator [Candidatus Muproteobacteria bacterium RBG_16_64_11]|uniref:Heavy metal-responsive transcriptional regulator n=1 Tax=Candidatus Muproteobacteria bacterium RBG_16_64_11 TaxID=1817758 RepID=A0A1F6T9U2_9PROT|nr:MAG: heavy metal-responsive transcriptional regulator [Candidatus Muproteobacteria bacterium RBG_16_64_11]